MKGQDRFEREALSFHRKVRNGYLDLARKNKKRFVILDAGASRKEIEAEILRHLEPVPAAKRHISWQRRFEGWR